MSVEFDVTNCSLDEEGWEDVLAGWADEQGEDDLFREPVFQQGAAFLLGTGSVRGATLIQDPESEVVHLRLPALASQADWRRGLQVARRALEQGGGELLHEDGTAYTAEQLTDALADELALRDFTATLQAIHPQLQQSEASLPLDAFELLLERGSLPATCTPEEGRALMARLAARVEVLAAAFPATTFTLQGGPRLTTWALIPTLVSNADLVSIEGLERPVPLARLRELLGDRCQRAGEETWLLPELDAEADAALLGQLEAASVDLDAWSRQNGFQVPEGGFASAGAGAEGVPAVYAPLAGAIARVVMAASQGEDPRLVRRALLREGADEQTADLALHVVGRILGELFDEQGEPTARSTGELEQLLIDDGLPATVAQLGVDAVSRLLGGPGDDDGGHECCEHDHGHGH